MKSFNAGNAQFYENLHKKYFDKAKRQEDSGPCEPPSQLLDMTADNDGMTSRMGPSNELSQLWVADSSQMGVSRSRSRSRGGESRFGGVHGGAATDPTVTCDGGQVLEDGFLTAKGK